MNYRAFITVGQMVSFGLVWGFDAVKNIVQFYCTMIEYRIYISICIYTQNQSAISGKVFSGKVATLGIGRYHIP
jgi:hypothetical protein